MAGRSRGWWGGAVGGGEELRGSAVKQGGAALSEAVPPSLAAPHRLPSPRHPCPAPRLSSPRGPATPAALRAKAALGPTGSASLVPEPGRRVDSGFAWLLLVQLPGSSPSPPGQLSPMVAPLALLPTPLGPMATSRTLWLHCLRKPLGPTLASCTV